MCKNEGMDELVTAAVTRSEDRCSQVRVYNGCAGTQAVRPVLHAVWVQHMRIAISSDDTRLPATFLILHLPTIAVVNLDCEFIQDGRGCIQLCWSKLELAWLVSASFTGRHPLIRHVVSLSYASQMS